MIQQVLIIIQNYVPTVYRYIFKSFCFSLAKKGAGADQQKSAPAQILNRSGSSQKTSAPTGSGSATL